MRFFKLPLLKAQALFSKEILKMDTKKRVQWFKEKGLDDSKGQPSYGALEKYFLGRVSFSEWMALMNEALGLEKSLKEREKILLRAENILEKLSSLQSTLWFDLIELAVALNSSNEVWIRRLISQIVKRDAYQIFFDPLLDWRDDMKTQMAHLFGQIVERAKQKVEQKNIYSTLK